MKRITKTGFCWLVVLLLIFSCHYFDRFKEPVRTVINSEVLSFGELLLKYSEYNQVSIEQAYCRLFGEVVISQEMKSGTYRIISKRLEVSENYHPYLLFYVQTDEYQNYKSLKKILSVQIDHTDHQGVTRYYGGIIYVQLSHSQLIYYCVDVMFYREGVETFVGSQPVELGGIYHYVFTLKQSEGKSTAFIVGGSICWPDSSFCYDNKEKKEQNRGRRRRRIRLSQQFCFNGN